MRFITILSIILILSCSGGSSTQSVEDVGDDVASENGNGSSSGGITPEPIASFTVSSYDGEAPHDITFTSTSTGEIDSYLWNVDNDIEIESTYAFFTHTYENAGTYDVSWNGRGTNGKVVPTGMYLYDVESDGRRLQGKMLFLK